MTTMPLNGDFMYYIDNMEHGVVGNTKVQCYSTPSSNSTSSTSTQISQKGFGFTQEILFAFCFKLYIKSLLILNQGHVTTFLVRTYIVEYIVYPWIVSSNKIYTDEYENDKIIVTSSS